MTVASLAPGWQRACSGAGAALALLVAGCAAVEPGPVRAPTLGLDGSDRFSAVIAANAPAPTAADLHWWRRFDDPALADWVERSLAANTDIAIADERVTQARALLRSVRADRLPRLGGQAELEARLRREPGQRALQPGAALALDYDADLWGGLRLAEGAAQAGVLRSQALLQAQRLASAGLAARAYIEWRLALHDYRLLADTAEVLREALRLTRVRVEAGISPVLDRDRAEAELASTEADAAAALVRAGQAQTALQVLAGDRPQLALPPFGQAPQALQPLPALQGQQPVVQPLDLLRLRPDLRAAEQALLAAAAEVGVARASLLPRLRLPGSVVLGAAAGGGAFELVRVALAGLLDAPLLDGGAGQARVLSARSQAREAELLYRQTLLQALRQVEDALLAREGAQRRIAAADRAGTAARAAQEQARTLYRVGLTNYLDVVDAQRTALASERLLLQARADAAAAAVRAFEAMGLMAGS